MTDHTVAEIEVTEHYVSIVCACGRPFTSIDERTARQRHEGHARVSEIRHELEDR
jgi:hypothetical protein